MGGGSLGLYEWLSKAHLTMFPGIFGLYVPLRPLLNWLCGIRPLFELKPAKRGSLLLSGSIEVTVRFPCWVTVPDRE